MRFSRFGFLVSLAFLGACSAGESMGEGGEKVGSAQFSSGWSSAPNGWEEAFFQGSAFDGPDVRALSVGKSSLLAFAWTGEVRAAMGSGFGVYLNAYAGLREIYDAKELDFVMESGRPQATPKMIPLSVTALNDYSDAHTVLVWNDKRIVKIETSGDSGKAWTDITPAGALKDESDPAADSPMRSEFVSVQVSPKNPSRIYALARTSPRLAADRFGHRNSLWVSENTGVTWSIATKGEPRTTRQEQEFTQFKVNPAADGVLYRKSFAPNVSREESTDGGKTWAPSALEYNSMSLAATGNELFFFGADDDDDATVSKLNDGKLQPLTTWKRFSSPGFCDSASSGVAAVLAPREGTSDLLAGINAFAVKASGSWTFPVIKYSSNGGASWDQEFYLPAHPNRAKSVQRIQGLVASPAGTVQGERYLYALTDGGLYRRPLSLQGADKADPACK